MTSAPAGLTRRALARFAAVPLVLSSPAPAQPAPSANTGAAFQNAARQLASVKLARNIEPASRFEA